MTTNQHAAATGEAEAPPVACGCRNGDPAATLAIQRKLVERAIQRDPVAVGELFDRYAEDVYGYLLAWTRDVEVAEQLTERVFHDVLSWLPVMQHGDGELAAWLIAMARDAVAHGPHARPARIDPIDPAQAVSLLDDPEREVVVFRLLLGHSLLHSAHLAGYRPRVAKALQFIACSTLWRNSVDPAAAGAASAAERAVGQPRDPDMSPPYYLDPKHDRRRADEFELRLNEPWGTAVVKGEDPELDNAMTVASALRMAAATVVAAPDQAFVHRVRDELMAATGGQASPGPSSPVPMRMARKDGAHSRRGVGFLAALASTRRLQLVAVLAALVVGVTAAVVMSASLSGPSSKCGSGGCLASPTTGAGPSAVLGGPPTSTTQALPFVAASSTTAGSAATAATAPPPTRVRASTTTGAPQTTARQTTTRRQTTTTVKPTTTTTTTTTTTLPTPGGITVTFPG